MLSRSITIAGPEGKVRSSMLLTSRKAALSDKLVSYPEYITLQSMEYITLACSMMFSAVIIFINEKALLSYL